MIEELVVKPRGLADPAIRAKALATRAANKLAREEAPKNKTQAANADARWSAERASEHDVDKFFHQVEIEQGLQLLAKMRRNCELAAKALNQRITSEEGTQLCKTCGGGKRQNKQWALIQPRVDPKTRLPMNTFFCSIQCVAMENQKNQGTFGVSDRGMTAGMKGSSPQISAK